ncbi:MAG: hypothetical protein ACK40G_09860 [Cytophagaceae bacterium]
MESITHYSNKVFRTIYQISLKNNVEKEETCKLVKACLHVLRDNMSQEDSIRFLTLLPPAFKVLFLENWKSSVGLKKVLNKYDFMQEVKGYYNRNSAKVPYNSEEELFRKISTIIQHIFFNPDSPNYPEILELLPAYLIQEKH